ncbi:MAG: cyclic nucleotide-binding domain-containing protein [Spirochaetales bacterium]|nr:cyclic nucleotide-binding domain-containing protein [Spirochaetales bacterium]
MGAQALSQAFSAFAFGALSAASLLLGAWTGAFLKPPPRLAAGIMAFGAGALFAALSLELVGEAVERLQGGFWPVGLGLVAGGLLFVALNRLVNDAGGFLRKRSTLQRRLRAERRRDVRLLLESLARVPIFASLPPEAMRGLAVQVRRLRCPAGTRVIAAGEAGTELYLVESGRLAVTRSGLPLATLGSGEMVGEMALLSGETRTADVTALDEAALLSLRKADFDRLLDANPELRAAVEALSGERREALEKAAASVDPEAWARKAGGGDWRPSSLELDEALAEAGGRKAGGAPMAIWLGILLDGIPESAVIGASMIGAEKASLALVLGLFIANYPEALSSAVGMRKLGMSIRRVSLLWGSIVLLTAVGAALGNLAFRSAPPELVALFESLAAGSMLAMLAETMMPEAFEQGGSITGMATILGFVSAVFLRVVG